MGAPHIGVPVGGPGVDSGFGVMHCPQPPHQHGRGRNEKRQLGDGDTERVKAPRLTEDLSHEMIMSAACRGNHTLALTETGLGFAFGKEQDGAAGPRQPDVCGLQPHAGNVPRPTNYQKGLNSM